MRMVHRPQQAAQPPYDAAACGAAALCCRRRRRSRLMLPPQSRPPAPFAAACGAAASCCRRRLRSCRMRHCYFLLPLLTVHPSLAAQPPHAAGAPFFCRCLRAAAAGGAAALCCCRWRRSRLMQLPHSAQSPVTASCGAAAAGGAAVAICAAAVFDAAAVVCASASGGSAAFCRCANRRWRWLRWFATRVDRRRVAAGRVPRSHDSARPANADAAQRRFEQCLPLRCHQSICLKITAIYENSVIFSKIIKFKILEILDAT
ncbi:hypothetical protein M885DRAFT_112526 [Pelagophyceae sp. CCMP2097]|nr:hypothetical protein M885DRAFT_112526 [Pelagophyceae sp. CCMP2097]